jgi:hypothetical protein
MRKASPAQILTLNKVFAPWYSKWKEWASTELSYEDAYKMIGMVHGMTQNDLSIGSPRFDETRAAFAAVRAYAKKLGYE